MTDRNKLLFIGLDAAEPQLIETWMTDGLLPNLKRLRDKGAYGRIGMPGDHLVGLPWPTLHRRESWLSRGLSLPSMGPRSNAF